MRRTILLTMLLACGTAVFAESIPLRHEDGTFLVPVLVNDTITLDFIIDTGAGDVSIPADVFSTLVRTGTVEQSDFVDTRLYRLADGSEQRFQRFRIRSLRVGSLELRDVIASVAPETGILLLGQSFLSRLRSWSIDNDRHLLIFNESPGADVAPSTAAPPESTTRSETTPETSTWMPLGTDADGENEFSVAVSSIKVNGAIRRAWVKRVSAPKAGDAAVEPGEWVSYSLSRYAFNCQRELWRIEALIQYYEDGTAWSAPARIFPNPWGPVPPDSVLNDELRFVCAHRR